MALTAYQTALQNLLQAPSSPTPLVSAAQQTIYINTARYQVAADAECIRPTGPFLSITNGTRAYGFPAISVTGIGFGSVIAVRSGYIGSAPMEVRQWEWFAQYYLPDASTGTPTIMAQQGQGASGTLVLWKTPNASFTLTLDVVCLPAPLVDDTTAETIPQLWTDAVPFYAAWLAMQSLQRQADAEMMLKRYELLVRRGRQLATSSELPDNAPGGAGAQLAAGKMPLGSMPEPR